MSENAAAIEVRNITHRYGSFRALDNVSFSIGRGGIGLLGPNGAGKSTLIRILLGLLKPSEGEGKVLGSDIRFHGTKIRERIGYLPEDDCLIPNLSAVGYLGYCAELSGLPPKEARKRAHWTLDRAGVGEARYREVQTFSAGMRQRVKFAQALVHDPEILFLDEPTNHMDPDGREEILSLARNLIRSEEKTVLLSSHILADVEAVCDEVILLSEGKVVLQGMLEELMSLGEGRFEIQAQGEVEEWARQLRQRGIPLKRGTQGWVAELSGGGDVRGVLEAAVSSHVQVRALKPLKTSLESIFLNALRKKEDVEHDADR